MARTIRAHLPLATLLLLTALVHGPALRFEFVGYDDPQRVTENPLVRDGLTAAGIRWALTTTAHAPYPHPLTWLSHLLDCELYGLDPAGHHATNVLLHIACVAALFGFLRRATGTGRTALLACALFALHPVQAGTVAWVSARPDLLATLFSLLALRCHAEGWRARTLAALAAALLSKPTAAVLPVVLLIVDRWPLGDRRPLGPRVREKLPHFVLAAAGAATVLLDRERVGGVDPALHVPLPLRLANAAVSVVRYLALAAWPDRLSAHVPHPYLPGGAPWSPWVVGTATLAILGLTAGAWLLRRVPAVRVGWTWFLAGLLPVAGIVQVGDQALAVRYLYFPGIGLGIAVAWGAAALLDAAPKTRMRDRLAAAGAVLLLGLLGLGTLGQASHWRDSRSLFSRAITLHPTDPVMLYNYAKTLEREGDPDRAAEYYRRTLEIRPGDAEAHNNLGVLLWRTGAIDAAREQFRAAVAIAPGFGAAWNNLGHTLRAAGRSAEAIDAYRAALDAAAPAPEAAVALAAALADSGREELDPP